VSREKGLDVLVDALPSLTDLPVQLTVIGDGPERRALEARAYQGASGARITWAGVIPDAARLLSAFDVIVISSRTEGTPMILLESMALAVPIVSTAVGGIPDVVSSAEAILVPSNDPVALAAAIRSVHDQPEKAEQRARRAAARLTTDFSTEAWLARYEQLYGSLIAQSVRGQR